MKKINACIIIAVLFCACNNSSDKQPGANAPVTGNTTPAAAPAQAEDAFDMIVTGDKPNYIKAGDYEITVKKLDRIPFPADYAPMISGSKATPDKYELAELTLEIKYNGTVPDIIYDMKKGGDWRSSRYQLYAKEGLQYPMFSDLSGGNLFMQTKEYEKADMVMKSSGALLNSAYAPGQTKTSGGILYIISKESKAFKFGFPEKRAGQKPGTVINCKLQL